MGDNFLKQQIKNFEKSTDLAVDVLEREKLIRRPEVCRRTYKGQPFPGESFVRGEDLYAIVSKDGQKVALSRGHHHLGDVGGQGADVLKEEMRGLGSTLKVRVVNVSGHSGWATLEVILE